MSLHDLPYELLEKIVDRLDSQSLFALGIVRNRRIRSVCGNMIKSLKIDRIPEHARPFLAYQGSQVRHLDLSHCNSRWSEVHAVINRCPNVTELNLVNATVHSLEFLGSLKELEVFSMTSPKENHIKLPRKFSLHRMRSFYIEAQPGKDSLSIIVRVINASTNIQRIHINLYGPPNYWDEHPTMPPLDAKRWRTIKTFICSQHLAGKKPARYLLRTLFADYLTPRIQDWIERDQLCYIFEHGELSGTSPTDSVKGVEINLLNRYQVFDSESEEIYYRNPRLPWGPPSSLRVNGLFRPLDAYMLSMLKELDITNHHASFTEASRLLVLTSSPSLEVLACSLCFIVPTSSRNSWSRPVLHEQLALVQRALEKLTLKKLSVSGNCYCGNGPYGCRCSSADFCRKCGSQTPLTTRELVDMRAFSHLEELTLRCLNLHAGAFANISHPNVHTVRLSLNAKSDCSNLLSFMRSSRNLQFFKLECFYLPFQSEEFWEALESGTTLKQLCLRRGCEETSANTLSLKLQIIFIRIVNRLESIHLHCPDGPLLFGMHQALVFEPEILREKLRSDGQRYELRATRTVNIGKYDKGRALCSTESFVGVVPPVGWSTT